MQHVASTPAASIKSGSKVMTSVGRWRPASSAALSMLSRPRRFVAPNLDQQPSSLLMMVAGLVDLPDPVELVLSGRRFVHRAEH